LHYGETQVTDKQRNVKLTDAIIAYSKGKKNDNPKLNHVKNALLNKGDKLYDTDTKGFQVVRSGVDTVSFRYYYRINGQRKSITLGIFPDITVAQARAIAKDKALDVANGKDPLVKKNESRLATQLTLGVYLEHDYALFMERAIDRTGYLGRVRNHFPELMKKPLAEINKTDLVKWLQEQTRHYKNHERGYSSDSIKNRYSALKSLMAHAVRNRVIDHSPFDHMEKLDFHRDETAAQQVKRHYLTIEQQRAFLHSIDNYQEKLRAERRNSRGHGKPFLPDLDSVELVSYHKPMLYILYFLGMRPGDVIGLEWEHIIDTPFACSLTKVLEKTRRKIKTPHVIPMPIQVRDLLRSWRKQRGNPDTGLVFPSPKTNSRMSRNCLDICWKWIVKDANLPPDYVLYTLRHNYISWLIMNGAHLKTIANLVGHQSTSMIEGHYGHLASSVTDNAANNFARLLHQPEILASKIK
jgi:integrase